MRVVRIQVFASQRYRGKDGFHDRRTITLEAEVESSDGQTSAIWDLQREADNALESWIEQHRFVEPEDPVEASPARSPTPSAKLSDDEIPY